MTVRCRSVFARDGDLTFQKDASGNVAVGNNGDPVVDEARMTGYLVQYHSNPSKRNAQDPNSRNKKRSGTKLSETKLPETKRPGIKRPGTRTL